MFDLKVINATLPDGRTGMDIGVKSGRIAAVEANLTGEAGEVIDARGLLVSPPFIDCHFHMDATLSLGQPRLNESGRLLDGIQIWGELKPLLTHDAVIERAMRYCDLAVTQGLLAIRTMWIFATSACLALKRCLRSKSVLRPILICNSWLSRKTVTIAIPVQSICLSARWI